MRIQLLPSTIDANGKASARQHLLSFVINDELAIDAGSLAFSCTDEQRNKIRDIILTHTHLDHIAGLPMFIDDLFSALDGPVRIHATPEMIEILERDIFNWAIYPRFSELSNSTGAVLEYRPFERGGSFNPCGYAVTSVPVNHQVAACGYIVSKSGKSIAVTGDTAGTDEFWRQCNEREDLAAIFVECAFPNEMSDLANVSCHLTPNGLANELSKLHDADVPVLAINLKPAYRQTVIAQLESLDRVTVMDVGRVYDF
jgi:cAMP phosphodiesterase